MCLPLLAVYTLLKSLQGKAFERNVIWRWGLLGKGGVKVVAVSGNINPCL